MDSTKKLYLSIAALAVVGGLVFNQKKADKKESQSHSLAAQQGELPKLSIDEETTTAIDSIELVVPPEKKDSDDPTEHIALAKTGEEAWSLTKPLKYAANINNVTSLLKNLTSLKLTEMVSQRSDVYAQWGLSDELALHVIFKKGDEVILDAYFGKNGSRGQMARIAGKEGVFAISGFSRYLYARDSNGWRDKSIFKFDDKEAEKVTVTNEFGSFEFNKVETKWVGTLEGKAIERFKPSKIDDLLRAYKTLNASTFGDDKKAADVGLGEKPHATLTIELKGGKGKYELLIGDTSEGTARWVQAIGRDEILSVSAWAADWALSDHKKFQEKTEEEKSADPNLAKHKPTFNPHTMPVTGVSHSNPAAGSPTPASKKPAPPSAASTAAPKK